LVFLFVYSNSANAMRNPTSTDFNTHVNNALASPCVATQNPVKLTPLEQFLSKKENKNQPFRKRIAISIQNSIAKKTLALERKTNNINKKNEILVNQINKTLPQSSELTFTDHSTQSKSFLKTGWQYSKAKHANLMLRAKNKIDKRWAKHFPQYNGAGRPD